MIPGVGFGLDLPWGGAPVGFATDEDGRDGPTAPLRCFLDRQAAEFSHAFFSFQPRDRRRLRVNDYAPAWSALVATLPPSLPRALHHTALNLAASQGSSAERGRLWDFTNELCERFDLRWINEDLGFWSVAGLALPYPLPPILDRPGLAACARNVRAAARALTAPLVVEFPGFAAGASVVAGSIDAYDFFRAVAEEADVAVTLDVGHLLSWRWWRGLRGEALLDELERLPLDRCFEIHLSGCELSNGRFVDAHHGRLLEEQLSMLDRLLPVCPRLQAVTFEDPRLDATGRLEDASAQSLAAIRRRTEGWSARPADASPSPTISGGGERRAVAIGVRDPPPPAPPGEVADEIALERLLAQLLYSRTARQSFRDPVAHASAGPVPTPLAVDLIDAASAPVRRRLAEVHCDELDEVAGAVRSMLRAHRNRGGGRLEDLFPRTVAAWRRAHPGDATLDDLFSRFGETLAPPPAPPDASPPPCLEEAFSAFAAAAGFADPDVLEDEALDAQVRAMAVSPEPIFRVPAVLHPAPGGWYAVSQASPPVLHACIDGRFLRGPITPAIVRILEEARQLPPPREPSGAVGPATRAALCAELVRMRLIA